jgi:hypothetical protein
MSEEKQTQVAVVPEFDGISFLSKIESAQTLSKKINIFNEALNQEPIIAKNLKAEMIKKGLNAGSSQDFDYVSIAVVEEALRQIFFRQVDFEIKQSYRDLNSFIVVTSIRYKCPISQEYRVVDGIGAVKLQQDAGAKVQDFNFTMKANALELGVGIAYSRAIKNGAKKLGRLFGSNLNRDEELENIVVFSEKVTNKDEFNLKLLIKLLEEKESKIKSHDLKTVQDVIDNKQVKAYKRFIDYLEKL